VSDIKGINSDMQTAIHPAAKKDLIDIARHVVESTTRLIWTLKVEMDKLP
jgi:hypothetical protein